MGEDEIAMSQCAEPTPEQASVARQILFEFCKYYSKRAFELSKAHPSYGHTTEAHEFFARKSADFSKVIQHLTNAYSHGLDMQLEIRGKK